MLPKSSLFLYTDQNSRAVQTTHGIVNCRFNCSDGATGACIPTHRDDPLPPRGITTDILLCGMVTRIEWAGHHVIIITVPLPEIYNIMPRVGKKNQKKNTMS